MARQVFVSYKYGDSSVRHFDRGDNEITTARHYVTEIQKLLDQTDNIYKGENDDESLAGFKDETIESKLRQKIFYSSITIVLISKNMIDPTLSETEQWIPWEISYSLREKTRDGRTSQSNGILAVVLPDEYGDYDYFVEPTGCQYCNCVNWKNNQLFSIIGENMFNRKTAKIGRCVNGMCTPFHTDEDHSYIYPVKWDVFVNNINGYLDHAINLRDKKDEFKLKILI